MPDKKKNLKKLKKAARKAAKKTGGKKMSAKQIPWSGIDDVKKQKKTSEGSKIPWSGIDDVMSRRDASDVMSRQDVEDVYGKRSEGAIRRQLNYDKKASIKGASGGRLGMRAIP